MNEPGAAALHASSLSPYALRAWVREVLQAAGASRKAASVTARALVDANQRGLDSHGVVFLSFYLPRLRAGTTQGDAEPEVVADLPGLVVVDGHDALGPYAASIAMELCCGKAQRAGAGVALVRRSSHFGAASYYSEFAARGGCVGIVFSNSDPGMAPLGGLGPLLGTNPVAIAAPRARGEPTPSLDIATSVVAQGKIILAQRDGVSIPEGWAVGADGAPTTDPSEALAGAVLPMGSHKGFGLAFMIDVLAGCMTGAGISPEIIGDPQATTPQDVGHCFIAIRVDAALPTEQYEHALSRLAQFVHDAPRAEWAGPFLIPGEREATVASERQDLIALPPTTVELLRHLGEEGGVPFPL